MKKLLLIFFLISYSVVFKGPLLAQETLNETAVALKDLKGVDRIRYINNNYYKLYSADFKNAEALLKWSETEAWRLGLKREYGFAQLYGGVVQYLSGNYPAVSKKYLGALQVFEEMNDEEGIAATHNELAVFYHKQNDLDNCFRSLDIAERISRKRSDYERLGTTLGNRGAILSVRGRIKEARPYFLEVYKIRMQQKDSVGLGYVLLDLAEVALAEGDQSGCMRYIDQSTYVRNKINDQYGVVVNLVFRGEMLIRAGRSSDAITFLEEGNRQAQSIGYPDLVRQSADLLTKVWREAGNAEKAFAYHEQSDLLTDSLLGVEKTKIVKELQTKYETEKKESEIREQRLKLNRNGWLIVFLISTVFLLTAIFLLWRQRLISRKDQMLAEQKVRHQREMTSALISSQEQERRRFASDLHDGLGQVISSLRLMLQRSTGEIPFSALPLLDQMHHDIRGIAFDLSPSTLNEDGLGTALRELASRLNQSNVIKISVSTTGMESRIALDLELALYRITQEWMNNIFRHGKAEKIDIQVVQHSDEVLMIIEDDGPGFDTTLLQHSGGNGWRNIQSRLTPFSGTVRVDSQSGKSGSVFIAEIPFVS